MKCRNFYDIEFSQKATTRLCFPLFKKKNCIPYLFYLFCSLFFFLQHADVHATACWRIGSYAPVYDWGIQWQCYWCQKIYRQMSFNVKFCIKLHQFHVFQIFLHWLLRVRTFSWILKSTDRLICLKIRRLYTLSFIINTLCILR